MHENSDFRYGIDFLKEDEKEEKWSKKNLILVLFYFFCL